MGQKSKQEKRNKKELLAATAHEKIKSNMLKIRECLKMGDTAGADHYSSLNKQLRALIK